MTTLSPSISLVLDRCHPLQIVWTVVHAVIVFVIDLVYRTGRQTMKGLTYESMNRELFSLSSYVYNYPEVSAVPAPGIQRFSSDFVSNSRLCPSDFTGGRSLINPFGAWYKFPCFHGSKYTCRQHQIPGE